MEQKPTVYTNRKDFLLDMYKYILHAVLEETSDTGAKKTTSNSVIHKLMDFYENLAGPLYEPITVQNATIRHSTSSYECKVCGTILQRQSSISDHVQIKHMFLHPYQCLECQISFNQLTALNKHLQHYHIEIQEDSFFYEGGENMNIQCLKYEKLVETERRTDHTNAICSKKIYYNNYAGAENARNGLLSPNACSYVQQFLNGWTFYPKDVTPIGYPSMNFATATTIKNATRLVADSECDNKFQSSLRRINGCEEIFLESIGACLKHLPKRNQEYFKSKMWMEGKSGDNVKKAKLTDN
ncbi:PR domain zinc finger protein 16 [Folsomia candida]|uniref:PR domain zinc finger protein 16 n=1 Tax=Folsomia candida TaxID=158441 RepID=A0A226E4B5_FOLCA|nr:PR domain zinc finger protein 16 [Folsomia candida]